MDYDNIWVVDGCFGNFQLCNNELNLPMSNTFKIKPCPFCGVTFDNLCGVEKGFDHRINMHYVSCVGCSVKMYNDREDKVIGMWNQRRTSKLDLDELQRRFDEALKNETPESLTEWINEIRSQ